MKKIMITGLALALCGCGATQLSTKSAYDATDKDGLVVIGVASDSGSYSLSFAKLDPETCKLNNALGLGNKAFSDNMFDTPISKPFLLDTFSPGVWVANYSSFEPSYNRRVMVYYNKGTVAFEVKAGEFIHIGKLVVSTSGARLAPAEPDRVKAFMADYPNITVEPTTVKPWITAFGPDVNETTIGCVPSRPAD